MGSAVKVLYAALVLSSQVVTHTASIQRFQRSYVEGTVDSQPNGCRPAAHPTQCKHQLAARLAAVMGRATVVRVSDCEIAQMLISDCV